jgi:hypothetical protein
MDTDAIDHTADVHVAGLRRLLGRETVNIGDGARRGIRD